MRSMVPALVLFGCGTASSPGPIDAANDANGPEVGVCSYTRDNGEHVACKSTETWCPDPNPLCGSDCTCEYSFDAYYLTCTPDQCGLDGGLE